MPKGGKPAGLGVEDAPRSVAKFSFRHSNPISYDATDPREDQNV
jgi:hypothetical protein